MTKFKRQLHIAFHCRLSLHFHWVSIAFGISLHSKAFPLHFLAFYYCLSFHSIAFQCISFYSILLPWHFHWIPLHLVLALFGRYAFLSFLHLLYFDGTRTESTNCILHKSCHVWIDLCSEGRRFKFFWTHLGDAAMLVRSFPGCVTRKLRQKRLVLSGESFGPWRVLVKFHGPQVRPLDKQRKKLTGHLALPIRCDGSFTVLVGCLHWLLIQLFHSSLPSGSWSKIPAFLSRPTWCAINKCLPVDLYFALLLESNFVSNSNLKTMVAPGCEGRWHWLWIVDWIFGGVDKFRLAFLPEVLFFTHTSLSDDSSYTSQ